MQWYLVIKTIKRNRYYYYQKTYRVGRQVKTLNVYYGPVAKVGRPPSRLGTGWNTTAISTRRIPIPPNPEPAPVISHPDLTGATTIPIPLPRAKPHIPPEAIDHALKVVTGDSPTQNTDQAWSIRKEQVHTNWRTFEKVEQITTTLGIRYTNEKGGNWYSPKTDEINHIEPKYWYATPGNSVEYRYYRCRCHELIHWTGGKNRLDRINFKRWGDRDYALEELTAELGACMLMKLLGYAENESMAYHTDYSRAG